MNVAHFPLLEIFNFLFRFQIVSFRLIVTMIIEKLLFPLSMAMLHLPTTSGHAIWQSPPAPYSFTPAAAELEVPAGDLCSSLLHNLEVLAQDNTFNCQPLPSHVKGKIPEFCNFAAVDTVRGCRGENNVTECLSGALGVS